MSVWGNDQTQFFYKLTPDTILNAIEASLGKKCSGRVYQLNSMENRVYDIELYDEKDSTYNVIAKFYRPGRWTEEQILEEHHFLFQLIEEEIPAVAPLRFKDGSSLHKHPESGIFYTIFPKIGGRSPDELEIESVEQVGRLLARMHNVGATRPFEHRIHLDLNTFGTTNLEFLKREKIIPMDLESEYMASCEELINLSLPLFEQFDKIRLHGDCHLGNLLHNQTYFWVDFDDTLQGPAVQDLWLLLPGRDAHAKSILSKVLKGYEQMRDFNDQSLQLIEPLRGLRLINFSSWISKRWDDPIFKQYFYFFGEHKYWQDQIMSLQEVVNYLKLKPNFWLS